MTGPRYSDPPWLSERKGISPSDATCKGLLSLPEDALGAELRGRQTHCQRDIGSEKVLAVGRLAALEKCVERLHVDGKGGQLLKARLIDEFRLIFIPSVDI